MPVGSKIRRLELRSLNFDRIKVKNIFENQSLIQESRNSNVSTALNMTGSAKRPCSNSRGQSTLVCLKSKDQGKETSRVTKPFTDELPIEMSRDSATCTLPMTSVGRLRMDFIKSQSLTDKDQGISRAQTR